MTARFNARGYRTVLEIAGALWAGERSTADGLQLEADPAATIVRALFPALVVAPDDFARVTL